MKFIRRKNDDQKCSFICTNKISIFYSSTSLITCFPVPFGFHSSSRLTDASFVTLSTPIHWTPKGLEVKPEGTEEG